jgi:hypothetical protein
VGEDAGIIYCRLKVCWCITGVGRRNRAGRERVRSRTGRGRWWSRTGRERVRSRIGRVGYTVDVGQVVEDGRVGQEEEDIQYCTVDAGQVVEDGGVGQLVEFATGGLKRDKCGMRLSRKACVTRTLPIKVN